jgi:hypothetical protein
VSAKEKAPLVRAGLGDKYEGDYQAVIIGSLHNVEREGSSPLAASQSRGQAEVKEWDHPQNPTPRICSREWPCAAVGSLSTSLNAVECERFRPPPCILVRDVRGAPELAAISGRHRRRITLIPRPLQLTLSNRAPALAASFERRAARGAHSTQ